MRSFVPSSRSLCLLPASLNGPEDRSTGQTRRDRKRSRFRARCGLSLIELLIVVTLLAIVAGGLQQAVSAILSTHTAASKRQDLLTQARLAMERMVLFVSETDRVYSPSPGGADGDSLKVTERVLDTYANATHTYAQEGDGHPDADFDSDGIANDAFWGVPMDHITFSFKNGKLLESAPDYNSRRWRWWWTPQVERTLCDHVTTFQCRTLSPDLVEITLSLSDGEEEVTLKTRARLRLIR